MCQPYRLPLTAGGPILMRKTMTNSIDKLPSVIKSANAEDETTGDAYEVFEFTKLLVGVVQFA
jgi:calcineurin-like phosphoesterase